jgi:hypothetical protein
MAMRIPSVLERISPISYRTKVGLRGFLLGCIVLGAAIGLAGRWLHQLPIHYTQSRTVEGFGIHSQWVQRGDKHEFVYLLAWPDGNKYGQIQPEPKGIFIYDTNRSAGRPEKYWVAATSGGSNTVRPVVAALPLSRQEFAELEHTNVWQEHLRPALIYESQQFDKWVQETTGLPNFTSRFTPLPPGVHKRNVNSGDPGDDGCP